MNQVLAAFIGSNVLAHAGNTIRGTALIAFVGASPLFGAISFTSLLPASGNSRSAATAVSADGRTIVGTSWNVPNILRPTMWSGQDWTPVNLGNPTGHNRPRPTDVSDSGNAVIGFTDDPRSPFRWTPETGSQVLPTDSNVAMASAVSPDGSFTVGLDVSRSRPIRWNGLNNPIDLPLPQGANVGRATIVSAAGNTLGTVGGQSGTSFARWTAPNSDPEILATFPRGSAIAPFAASTDESILAGMSSPDIFTLETNPWRWSQSEGVEYLPVLDGTDSANVIGMSGDGSVILLSCFDSTDVTEFFDAVWTPEGLQTVESYLTAFGVNLDGWTEFDCNDISRDGMTFVGSGVDPQGMVRGWVATIPAPSAGAVLAAGVAFACRRRRS